MITFVFSLCILQALGQPAFLKDGLVSYYTFSGNGNDSTSNHNDFSISKQIITHDRFGQDNQAVYMDRNEQLWITNPTNYPLGSSQRSFSVWVRPRPTTESEPYQNIFWYGNPDYSYGAIGAFLQYAGNGQYGFHFGMGPAIPNQSDRFVAAARYWDFTKWHHVVWTFSQTNGATFYLDGVQIPIAQSIDKSNIINTKPGSFRIGGPSGYGVNGELDDLRVYSNELSASEVMILNNYESTKPGASLKALATTKPINGFVTIIELIEPGSGYTIPPQVKITGGGGNGATAIAILSGGSVEKIIVTNPGKNYSFAPTVAIDPPPSIPSIARATSEVSGGFVVQAKLLSAGSGYTSPPKIVFAGGGGTGATARAVLFNGVISEIVITSPGSGYTSSPVVLIDPPPHQTKLEIAISKIKITATVLPGVKYSIEASNGDSTWMPFGDPFIPTDTLFTKEVDVVDGIKMFRLNQVQ